MKRRTLLLAVTLLVFSAGMLAGCSGGGGNAKCSEALSKTLEKFDETKIDTTVPYGDDVYESNFERLYNFSMDEVDDGVIGYASEGGYADEISIVRVKDSKDVSGVRKYMEARMEQRRHDFAGYKPEEVSKIDNGKVVVQQNYVIMIIADNADDIATQLKGELS